MTKQPARPPLPGSVQLQLRESDVHDVTVRHLFDHAIFFKQSHGPAWRLSMFIDLHALLPNRLLLTVDFAQVDNVALDDLAPSAAPVLDDAPVAVFFAIFLSGGGAQKHNDR